MTRYCSASVRLTADQMSKVAAMEEDEFLEFVAFLRKVRAIASAYRLAA